MSLSSAAVTAPTLVQLAVVPLTLGDADSVSPRSAPSTACGPASPPPTYATSPPRSPAGPPRSPPGGWLALIDIDDLFGHDSLSPATHARLDAFADDAFAGDALYDFRMGRKLALAARQVGLETLTTTFSATAARASQRHRSAGPHAQARSVTAREAEIARAPP